MNLRPVEMRDHEHVKDCYKLWPLTDRGPVTDDMVTRWIRRWMYRDDEECRIAEESSNKVGLITYRLGICCCVVDSLIVHKFHQGQGHSRNIVRQLAEDLMSEGVVVAEFDAMPGAVWRDIDRGKYQYVSESLGQTGPLMRGRLTMEMVV